jgi:hypothetical protein
MPIASSRCMEHRPIKQGLVASCCYSCAHPCKTLASCCTLGVASVQPVLSLGLSLGLLACGWKPLMLRVLCRWAMLGAAGCIAPEVLAKAGVIPEATGVLWFQSGVIPPAGSYGSYWADPFTLFFIEIIAMQVRLHACCCCQRARGLWTACVLWCHRQGSGCNGPGSPCCC